MGTHAVYHFGSRPSTTVRSGKVFPPSQPVRAGGGTAVSHWRTERNPRKQYREELLNKQSSREAVASSVSSLMAKISDELRGICTQTNVPDEFATWLEEQEILEPVDLALLARSKTWS